MRTTLPSSHAPRSLTAAILGASTPTGTAIAVRLAQAGCRLLLSDPDQAAVERTMAAVLAARPQADVEVLPCARTSCWEADLIVLTAGITSRSSDIERIRDVATGKIVLAAGAAAESGPVLRTRLPHARLVLMSGRGPALGSSDDEARETLVRLFEAGERTTHTSKKQTRTITYLTHTITHR